MKAPSTRDADSTPNASTLSGPANEFDVRWRLAESALACLEGRQPYPGRPVRAPLPKRPHAAPCACALCRTWARVIVAAPRLHPMPEAYTLSAARARLHHDASQDDPEHDQR